MIKLDTIREIDSSSKEGKMLIAALSILTSIDKKQIDDQEFGGMTHPDDALQKVIKISNQIYYEEEYKLHLKSLKRDNKINNILN